jgi:RimJ/RimL family protein N-acetyltransferase
MNLVIREANPDDTQAIMGVKLNYLNDSKTIPINLDEYPNDYSKELEVVNKLIREKNSTLIVAIVDGQIIGNIDINGSQRKRLFHTAWVGMGIHNDWQNKGIGSQLLTYAMNWANQNEHLKLITLEAYATNFAAIQMYKKHNFKETGRIKNFFFQDNQYLDNISMALHL